MTIKSEVTLYTKDKRKAIIKQALTTGKISNVKYGYCPEVKQLLRENGIEASDRTIYRDFNRIYEEWRTDKGIDKFSSLFFRLIFHQLNLY